MSHLVWASDTLELNDTGSFAGTGQRPMPVKNRHRFFCFFSMSGEKMSVEMETKQIFIEKEPWWISAVKQLGLPTILLMLVGFGVYNSSVWLGQNILKPLTERQVEFINQVEKSVQKITIIVEDHQKNNSLIAKELEKINSGIEKLNISSTDNGKKLEKIDANLHKQ